MVVIVLHLPCPRCPVTPSRARIRLQARITTCAFSSGGTPCALIARWGRRGRGGNQAQVQLQLSSKERQEWQRNKGAQGREDKGEHIGDTFPLLHHASNMRDVFVVGWLSDCVPDFFQRIPCAHAMAAIAGAGTHSSSFHASIESRRSDCVVPSHPSPICCSTTVLSRSLSHHDQNSSTHARRLVTVPIPNGRSCLLPSRRCADAVRVRFRCNCRIVLAFQCRGDHLLRDALASRQTSTAHPTTPCSGPKPEETCRQEASNPQGCW